MPLLATASAKLAVLAFAPSENPPICEQNHGVEGTTSHRGHIHCSEQNGGRFDTIELVAGAQPTAFSPTPAKHRPRGGVQPPNVGIPEGRFGRAAFVIQVRMRRRCALSPTSPMGFNREKSHARNHSRFIVKPDLHWHALCTMSDLFQALRVQKFHLPTVLPKVVNLATSCFSCCVLRILLCGTAWPPPPALFPCSWLI